MARIRRLLTLVAMITLATEVWGKEFEETDTLPKTENLLFSASQIGIVSHDGRWFALDRQTRQAHQLEAAQFVQQFPKPWPPAPHEDPQYGPDILRSSSGQEFQVTQAQCGEEADIGHAIRYEQRLFPDVLNPCTCVSALEVIGNEVWFGTLESNEAGETQAEGVVVQARDKKQKVTAITVKSGLTPGPVHMLRKDPFTKTVWAATARGLTQIDQQFHVRWVGYWYEDFDATSGRSVTSLVTTDKRSNAFAVLGRELGVQNWQAYRRMVQQIPAYLATGSHGYSHDFAWLLYDMHMTGEARSFPKELNELIPFVMQAAQSEDPTVRGFGLLNVCKFNDPQIPTFVKSLAATRDLSDPNYYWLRECVQHLKMPKP